jgi:NMD protein affecting ribosome stability and mRNA decay
MHDDKQQSRVVVTRRTYANVNDDIVEAQRRVPSQTLTAGQLPSPPSTPVIPTDPTQPLLTARQRRAVRRAVLDPNRVKRIEAELCVNCYYDPDKVFERAGNLPAGRCVRCGASITGKP